MVLQMVNPYLGIYLSNTSYPIEASTDTTWTLSVVDADGNKPTPNETWTKTLQITRLDNVYQL